MRTFFNPIPRVLQDSVALPFITRPRNFTGFGCGLFYLPDFYQVPEYYSILLRIFTYTKGGVNKLVIYQLSLWGQKQKGIVLIFISVGFGFVLSDPDPIKKGPDLKPSETKQKHLSSNDSFNLKAIKYANQFIRK